MSAAHMRAVRLPTFDDFAAPGDVTLVPGSQQRRREMATLRAQGWSLDEIAVRYGVSRERVRQILRAHGGPDPQDVSEARRRRPELEAEARVDELLVLWRSGEGPAGAALALGLQVGACRDAIARGATDVDRAARRASMARARGRTTKAYTERDIVAALTAAATALGHSQARASTPASLETSAFRACLPC